MKTEDENRNKEENTLTVAQIVCNRCAGALVGFAVGYAKGSFTAAFLGAVIGATVSWLFKMGLASQK